MSFLTLFRRLLFTSNSFFSSFFSLSRNNGCFGKLLAEEIFLNTIVILSSIFNPIELPNFAMIIINVIVG